MSARSSFVLGVFVALASSACADPNARAPGPDDDWAEQSRAQFDLVSPVLVKGCASLDCHGDAYRNYRLHGYGGRRLDPTHRPDFPDTTLDEVQLNFEATLAIEPEIVARVADGDLEAVGELTLVRKARGAEDHDGEAPFEPGGDAERCLVSWLAGGVDADACAAAELD